MSRPSHSEYVLQQLNSQREWGFLCDCCVVIGDIYFRAHRAVLTACSSYFRMLFIGQQQQQQHAQAAPAQLSLNQAEVSAESFDLILQLMYLGRVVGQPSDFQQLRAAMSFLQLYYVPRSLEELREAGAPSSSSPSPPPRPSGPAQGPMLFGVRMRGPVTGGGVVATAAAAVLAEGEAEPRPSSEVGPELDVNQDPGRLPRKQGRSSSGSGSASASGGMKGRMHRRFGRRYTCDRCGFVFSCERLLDEHSLTCGSCRALPGEAAPVTTETEGQVQVAESPARPVVKTEPEDTAATGLGDLMVVEVHEEEGAAIAGGDEDEACGLGSREPGWTEDEEEEEGGEGVEGMKEEVETEAGDGTLGPACELCGAALSESQRADHYVSHHLESVCACGKCGRILVKGGRLREHAERCLGDGQASGLFSCHICGVSFHRRRQLEEHVCRHKAGTAYRCPGCPLSFEEEGPWAEHVSVCLLPQAGPPGPPLRNAHRKHVCQLCGKAFFQRCHLREHHATHTREKEFACHICGKNFLRERLLRLHLDMHRGVARYVCLSCGQGTYRKQDHLRHLVTHLSAGQVACEVCFQVLGGSQQLQRHMDMHLHTCGLCGDKFKLKKDLSNHHLTNHTKKSQ
ncbi:zinc finger and BTB domain-containing protein 1 isoform X2 [Rhinoraja longicauda]